MNSSEQSDVVRKLLRQIVQDIFSEARRLRHRAEDEIRYYQRKNIPNWENKEVLFDNVQKYTDVEDLCQMCLNGDLHVGELCDELRQAGLGTFVLKLRSFNPELLVLRDVTNFHE